MSGCPSCSRSLGSYPGPGLADRRYEGQRLRRRVGFGHPPRAEPHGNDAGENERRRRAAPCRGAGRGSSHAKSPPAADRASLRPDPHSAFGAPLIAQRSSAWTPPERRRGVAAGRARWQSSRTRSTNASTTGPPPPPRRDPGGDTPAHEPGGWRSSPGGSRASSPHWWEARRPCSRTMRAAADVARG